MDIVINNELDDELKNNAISAEEKPINMDQYKQRFLDRANLGVKQDWEIVYLDRYDDYAKTTVRASNFSIASERAIKKIGGNPSLILEIRVQPNEKDW